MNVDMNAFIREKYNIYACSEEIDPNDLSSAKNFILIDHPDKFLSMGKVNALFINSFINKTNDLVVVDFHRPLDFLQDFTQHSQTMQLDNDINVVGWGHEVQSLEEKCSRSLPICNVLKQIEQRCLLLSQYISLPEIEQNRQMQEFQQRFEQNRDEIVNVAINSTKKLSINLAFEGFCNDLYDSLNKIKKNIQMSLVIAIDFPFSIEQSIERNGLLKQLNVSILALKKKTADNLLLEIVHTVLQKESHLKLDTLDGTSLQKYIWEPMSKKMPLSVYTDGCYDSLKTIETLDRIIDNMRQQDDWANPSQQLRTKREMQKQFKAVAQQLIDYYQSLYYNSLAGRRNSDLTSFFEKEMKNMETHFNAIQNMGNRKFLLANKRFFLKDIDSENYLNSNAFVSALERQNTVVLEVKKEIDESVAQISLEAIDKIGDLSSWFELEMSDILDLYAQESSRIG